MAQIVKVTFEGQPSDEEVARVIARALGHNDETGMHWERYVLAARKLLDAYRLRRGTP